MFSIKCRFESITQFFPTQLMTLNLLSLEAVIFIFNFLATFKLLYDSHLIIFFFLKKETFSFSVAKFMKH